MPPPPWPPPRPSTPLSRPRPPEQVALELPAAHGFEDLALLARLDPFGDHRHVQRGQVGQVNDHGVVAEEVWRVAKTLRHGLFQRWHVPGLEHKGHQGERGAFEVKQG